jgi:hypothetical protein
VTTRPQFLTLALAILVTGQALAQAAATEESSASPAAGADQWSFYASAFAYFPPESQDYLSPVLTADHGPLHLEARYNYEALDTGSLWAGYNFSAGTELAFEATAMVGAVLGDTAGIAPGYRISLTYSSLELSSEGEYLFDSRDQAESFFYTWTELSYSPADWFRTGLVGQRTRAYEAELDIQRGLLAGFTYRDWDFTIYLFNPDRSDRMLVLSLGAGF